MSKSPEKLDANQSAHRAVHNAAAAHEGQLPADMEAAWAQWSAGVGKVDERGKALLRAAFEAGYEVARQGSTRAKS